MSRLVVIRNLLSILVLVWLLGGCIVPPAEDETPAEEKTPAPAEPAVAEPAPQTSTSLSVTVTGTVVNLRGGPGTDYPAVGLVHEGDQVSVTGRNAAGDWLQAMHPAATGELVWIYGPLTDVDAATVQALAEVATVEVAVSTPTDLSHCVQWHTVNPNETRLQQITDWFGLDVPTVAALNEMDPEAPLTAGGQICLSVTEQVQPQPVAEAPAPQPQPAPIASGQPCITPWGNPHPCPHIPNHPEQATQPVSGVPILYHAPGSYGRSLPGLDYDFELVLGDDSTMWNWRMREPAACYDALRAHMAEIPREIGLKRLEVRLSDPVEVDGEGLVDMEFSASYSYPDVDWSPIFDGTMAYEDRGKLHPDLASVRMRCYDSPRGRPDDDVFCRIYPNWGNSNSIHLDAAVNILLADTAGQMSQLAKANQYHRQNFHKLQANAYVVPLIDDGSGDPAGFGPCMAVTRAG